MSAGSNDAGPSTAPHPMRIASGGSIQAYVKHALQCLQETPSRPVVLHTLPPDQSESSAAAEKKEGSKREIQTNATSTLLPMTTAIPKLISVVELIKRAYIEQVDSAGGKGKHKAVGIWQYNRSGCVSPAEVADNSLAAASAENAGTALSRVLLGRTKPRMTHHPYLEITLSVHPLGLEKERDVTCQYVLAQRRRRRKGDGEQTKSEPLTAVDEGHRDVDMEGADLKARSSGKGDEAKAGKEKPVSKDTPKKIAKSDGQKQSSGNGKHKRKGQVPQESRTPKRKKLSTSADRGK